MKNRFIIVLFLIFICSNVSASTTYKEVEFVRCVDGDTAVFNVDEEETKFRFLAIDTPETVHPSKDVEAYGKDASEYTCNRLTNANEIVVEYESANKKDKYGRSLAWIWVDGSLLQKDLIDIGYAEVAYIYGNYKYTNSLCLLQQDAKSNQLGIWYDQTREEGYCSTVDLSDVSNNIKYSYSNNENNEDEKKLNSTIESIKNIDDKLGEINNLLDSENSEKVVIYIIIGISLISMIFKYLRK